MLIFKIIKVCKLSLANWKGRLIVKLQKLQQSALYNHGGEGAHEQPSKQSFVVDLTAKKIVQSIFVHFEKMLPGFEQHLPMKCLVIPLFVIAKCYIFLDIVVSNVA
jgi:hypothetical protein